MKVCAALRLTLDMARWLVNFKKNKQLHYFGWDSVNLRLDRRKKNDNPPPPFNQVGTEEKKHPTSACSFQLIPPPTRKWLSNEERKKTTQKKCHFLNELQSATMKPPKRQSSCDFHRVSCQLTPLNGRRPQTPTPVWGVRSHCGA